MEPYTQQFIIKLKVDYSGDDLGRDGYIKKYLIEAEGFREAADLAYQLGKEELETINSFGDNNYRGEIISISTIRLTIL